jgi:pimeloyl-ACP methyl ester carboxylesterase
MMDRSRHCQLRSCAAALAALLAACASSRPAPMESAPAFQLEKCGIADSPEPLLCGDLAVPENRDRPGDRTITLNVVIVPATGDKTLPPLYDLAGGPGIAAASAAGFWATAGSIHRQHRDVVLLDARGTGGSAPLACPVSVSSPLSPVLDPETVKDCRERLEKDADLAQYSTYNIVEDIDAVRAALGHDRIDLIGLSYGSRVAQEYVRVHRDRVRAIALLGTLSPDQKMPLPYARNAHAALQALVLQCKADTACRKAVPDLSRDIASLQAKLSSGPLLVTLADGTKAALEAGPFWEAVRAQLAVVAGQRRLPWLLHQAARGNLAPILDVTAGRAPKAYNGQLLSISCPEDTMHITPDEAKQAAAGPFGDYRVRQQIGACLAWALPPTPGRPGFLESDVPALLMAGDADAITPVPWAQAVATRLSNARVVVVPGLGHFPDGLTHMECYDAIIAKFFEDGSAANLDLECVKTMQPPPFQTKPPPPATQPGAPTT